MEPSLKPYVLLSTPRSGSTPIYQILEHYLRQNNHVYGVEEILNPTYGDYEDTAGVITWNRTHHTATLDMWDKHYEARFELVKKHHGKIFFKAFPSVFRPESTDWLLKNFTFIAHERSNYLEQVLSYLVSFATNKWYELKGFNIPANSLKASHEAFKSIESTIFHYIHLKKIARPVAVFSYEDFLAKNPQQLLLDKGFDLPFDSQGLNLTPKQNEGDKLQLFANKDEILKWYQDSFFQQISKPK